MRRTAAGIALTWLLGASVIEVSSYLPVDPEWSLLPTAALFATTFLIGAIGAFFMAPELTLIRTWPERTLRRLKWFLAAWGLYTLIWFGALLALPGIPTHCGTPGFPSCGHEYVFDSHGFVTVTDRAGFVAGIRVLVRLFASPPIALMTIILVAYRTTPIIGEGAVPKPAIAGNSGKSA
jgi:hypothetical protein